MIDLMQYKKPFDRYEGLRLSDAIPKSRLGKAALVLGAIAAVYWTCQSASKQADYVERHAPRAPIAGEFPTPIDPLNK